MKKIFSNWFLVLLFLAIGIVFTHEIIQWKKHHSALSSLMVEDSSWQAPSMYLDIISDEKEREQVSYGEELISHTAEYLGPQGSVLHLSNGMNCQNCHLDAGTRSWGNNYGAVAANYPKFRERSGQVETIPKRVNDCFERSLNGNTLDTDSREMKAIIAYMKWLGKEVKKGTKPLGSGIEKLPFPDRAADPEKGRIVFMNQCSSCHGSNGEGQMNAGNKSFATPPLWGSHSYNDGAGLFRLSSFAGFVKNNMPYNQASHHKTVLTNEQAWDVAAFVNSQPRPHKDQKNDWPDISKKPVDFPFGPYADSFPASQHKYGPFNPIVVATGGHKKN